MKITNPIAIFGESIASEYLKKKGYTILERNFSKRYGEIDIIAASQDTLVFVEVKTRRSMQYGHPLEAITPWKLRSLTKTAEFYQVSHPNTPKMLRIDAIAIELSDDQTVRSIEHVENIS